MAIKNSESAEVLLETIRLEGDVGQQIAAPQVVLKAAPRKMPVRKTLIKLHEDWEGWDFTARVNVPVLVLEDFESREISRLMHGLSYVILDWNFVDEEGEPLPPPTSETLGLLPIDLLTKMMEKAVEEMGRLPLETKTGS